MGVIDRVRGVFKSSAQVAGPMPAGIGAALAAEGMGSNPMLGPGGPIQPTRGYSARPRQFDYPSGINLNNRPRASYGRPSFETLKKIIDAYDIAQICIAHKIDSMRGMDLLFAPADDVDDDVSLAIKAAKAALAFPDRDLPFDAWLAKFLDGMFRYDAATLYRRRNVAGQVIGLEVVDGTTITPFVDEHGRKPQAPAPAYTQSIQGVPWTWLTTDDLIYAPFRPQSDSPFGLAAMESVLLTANTDLRMQWHMLNLFTAGSMPAGFLNTPEDSSTPDQVQQWQDYWDALMLGDQDVLRQIKVIPSGMVFTEGSNPTFDEDFALSMIRRTCAAFGVVPNDIGLTMDVNLANGETQTDVQFRVNDRPPMRYVQGILSNYLQRDLGLPVKVTFDDGQEKEDRLAEAQTWEVYVNVGAASVDEMRTELLGLPIDNTRPVPRFYAGGKQGPIPLVDIFAISGPVDPDTAAPADELPIAAEQFPGNVGVMPDKLPGDADFKRAPINVDDPTHPGNELGPVAGTGDVLPPAPVAKEATQGVTAATGIVGHDLIGQDDDEDEPVVALTKSAELAAFARFVKASKRAGRWRRDFTFTAVPEVDAHNLNDMGRSQVRKAAGEIVAAGLAVVAADTGRVLMLQRGLDPADPASGMWEFPGGCLETGEDPELAARREWSEEVGLTVPVGVLQSGWTSANGVYQGFVYVIDHEGDVDILNRGDGMNPDDPDGDVVESIAWWFPGQLDGNPSIRPELADSLNLVLPQIYRGPSPIGDGSGAIEEQTDPEPEPATAAPEEVQSPADPMPAILDVVKAHEMEFLARTQRDVYERISALEDLNKAGGVDPKGRPGDPRWHDAPIRKVMSKTVDFHATKIATATSALLTPDAIRSLVEAYVGRQP